MRVCVYVFFVCGLSAVLIQANQQNYCHYSRLLPPAGQGIPWLATIVVVSAYECVKIVVIYYNLRPKRSKQLTSQKEERKKNAMNKQDKRTKLGQQQQ